MKELIQQAFDFGIDYARKNAQKDHEFRALDFVRMYQDSDIYDNYYMTSAFALTSLPHKKPKDDTKWVQQNGPFHLLVEGGYKLVDGEPVFSGVPYGSRARLILYYLVTKAVERQTPKVQLGRSMTAWMKSMKIPASGPNYETIREQVMRLASCRITFNQTTSVGSAMAQENIVGAMFTPRADGEQVWEDCAVLSEGFFEALRSHKFPVDARAISVLQNQSQSMDVYIWLCYRMQKVDSAMLVPWKSLYQQFGSGYSALRYFKRNFLRDVLPRAMAVYPKVMIEIDDANGIILHPSPPAIDFVKTYKGGAFKSIDGDQKP
ncbi:replication protein RepA [Roseibium sp. RKSG952]|uniref:replication protein RepA n=1 Tax=Roseibium sp. RKSG952 TaxID=2529384 RepID=UPI0018AD2DAD|nr:replication protein RepA [Roseibium sp. RKSG952]